MKTQSKSRPARDRLLDAADELFYLNGIATTGVDDVLARAEVSVATLYAHFGSKDGLLQASLERRLETWKAQWDEAINAAESVQDRLLAVFDAISLYRDRQSKSRWCAFLLATAEIPDPDHPAAELIKRETSLLRRRLHSLSEPLTDKPDELAAAILLIYNGTLASFLRGCPEDPIRHGRTIAAHTVRAYAK